MTNTEAKQLRGELLPMIVCLSSCRPDPHCLTAAWREPHGKPSRGGDGAFGDGYRQGIVQPVGLGPVGINLGDISPSRGEEGERNVESTTFLIGDGAEKPVLAAALPPGDHDVVPNSA